jgi:hypothetical protein
LGGRAERVENLLVQEITQRNNNTKENSKQENEFIILPDKGWNKEIDGKEGKMFFSLI